jgi:hypothetical protein
VAQVDAIPRGALAQPGMLLIQHKVGAAAGGAGNAAALRAGTIKVQFGGRLAGQAARDGAAGLGVDACRGGRGGQQQQQQQQQQEEGQSRAPRLPMLLCVDAKQLPFEAGSTAGEAVLCFTEPASRHRYMICS